MLLHQENCNVRGIERLSFRFPERDVIGPTTEPTTLTRDRGWTCVTSGKVRTHDTEQRSLSSIVFRYGPAYGIECGH